MALFAVLAFGSALARRRSWRSWRLGRLRSQRPRFQKSFSSHRVLSRPVPRPSLSRGGISGAAYLVVTDGDFAAAGARWAECKPEPPGAGSCPPLPRAVRFLRWSRVRTVEPWRPLDVPPGEAPLEELTNTNTTTADLREQGRTSDYHEEPLGSPLPPCEVNRPQGSPSLNRPRSRHSLRPTRDAMVFRSRRQQLGTVCQEQATSVRTPCTPCAAVGKFKSGATACGSCLAGAMALEGSVECRTRSVGKSREDEGCQSWCTQCETRGFSTPGVCNDCEEERFSNIEGGSSFATCSLQSASAVPSPTACSDASIKLVEAPMIWSQEVLVPPASHAECGALPRELLCDAGPPPPPAPSVPLLPKPPPRDADILIVERIARAPRPRCRNAARAA